MSNDRTLRLLSIDAPHFNAGIELGGRVAPIIAYMRGWSESRIRAYCVAKRWRIEVIE